MSFCHNDRLCAITLSHFQLRSIIETFSWGHCHQQRQLLKCSFWCADKWGSTNRYSRSFDCIFMPWITLHFATDNSTKLHLHNHILFCLCIRINSHCAATYVYTATTYLKVIANNCNYVSPLYGHYPFLLTICTQGTISCK